MDDKIQQSDGSQIRTEIVDLNSAPFITRAYWSKFSEQIKTIRGLEPGKCIKFWPRLSRKDAANLIAACRYRGFSIHVRDTPEATYAWFKDERNPPPSVIAQRKTAGVFHG